MKNPLVVHVINIREWKSVLDVWFKQGYGWFGGNSDYLINAFRNNGRYLFLHDDGTIVYSDNNQDEKFMEYSEFMAQQKEDNKMATVYEVSQSVFDNLQWIKDHENTSLLESIKYNTQVIDSIEVDNKAILRYLADDPAIEFKVKEPLYRLWAKDEQEQKVYFLKLDNNIWGTPVTNVSKHAFTAPLEEIKKWQTPDWNLEEVQL